MMQLNYVCDPGPIAVDSGYLFQKLFRLVSIQPIAKHLYRMFAGRLVVRPAHITEERYSNARVLFDLLRETSFIEVF
jgi:hypothetical protein